MSIIKTIFEIGTACFVSWVFLEGIKDISPFIYIILGFLFGIVDFIIYYYKGWGVMACLEEGLDWLSDWWDEHSPF